MAFRHSRHSRGRGKRRGGFHKGGRRRTKRIGRYRVSRGGVRM